MMSWGYYHFSYPSIKIDMLTESRAETRLRLKHKLLWDPFKIGISLRKTWSISGKHKSNEIQPSGCALHGREEDDILGRNGTVLAICPADAFHLGGNLSNKRGLGSVRALVLRHAVHGYRQCTGLTVGGDRCKCLQ